MHRSCNVGASKSRNNVHIWTRKKPVLAEIVEFKFESLLHPPDLAHGSSDLKYLEKLLAKWMKLKGDYVDSKKSFSE